ncbi:MAG: 2Fe-2S iron-sulfur cluster binding domain-containing protein [Planctomycetota bacterium]|nr:2Fe-2S iron-sulfur cluster binding domain-containing protein [Planctomycetota bacterium]
MTNIQLEKGQSVDVGTASTLLEAIQNHGVEISLGCESGRCGVCMIEVVDGELEGASEEEKSMLQSLDAEDHHRLACQARLQGDVTLRSA